MLHARSTQQSTVKVPLASSRCNLSECIELGLKANVVCSMLKAVGVIVVTHFEVTFSTFGNCTL